MYEIEFRDIILPDGAAVPVDSKLYPMLMEWEWQVDPDTKIPFRKEGNRVIRLFDEIVRLGATQREAHALPLLDRQTTHRLFAESPEYRDLLDLVRAQRQIAAEVGMPFPSVYAIVGVSLSYALRMYYAWCSKSGRYKFIPDEKHLTPGTLQHDPAAPTVGVYRTLGEFLDSEYTGEWRTDQDSPAGMVPETYGDVLEDNIAHIWNLLLLDYEEVEQEHVVELADYLDEAGYSVVDLVLLVRQVISHYVPS